MNFSRANHVKKNNLAEYEITNIFNPLKPQLETDATTMGVLFILAGLSTRNGSFVYDKFRFIFYSNDLNDYNEINHKLVPRHQ